MATQNEVNIGVNVSDNGTAKKVVKNFEEITKSANTAQKAAAGISAPAPVRATMAPAGTAGSRMAAQKSAPTGSQEIMSEQAYGTARGSAGLTGAGARDFANQAQGLGGLVRLYATFAANLFAASAAFTALKNAADTTNLVKGLNTLGAASGQSLGSLSKRLVEVTDGAVSMREAMEATAKASSAGMSSKDIERLGLVAKNASLALGVSMPDALSRISRGIVKLEPELLDELGLFTKIGPATEKYALEIGKSANSLTDFERRQAFANAVLAEGEKKFGALAEAAANPYDKLLSSLKDILSSGGELINKVLSPIVNLLANSPTALIAALTGIGYVLLKQALPAIGQLRAGLRSSAEEALSTAEAFKASFSDKFQTILEKRFKIPDLEAGVKKAQAELDKLTVPTKLAASVGKLVAGDEASIGNVREVLKRKNALIQASIDGTKKVSEAQVDAAQKEILYINAAIKAYETKQALAKGRVGTQEEADKPISRFDPEVLALQKYEKLRSKVDQTNAIANAAEVAGVAGIRTSWSLLNKEITEKNITGFAKYSTLVQGGLAAVGTRIMGVIGSLSKIGEVIGLGIAAFSALDSVFSKNAKQAEVFNKALATSEDSIANVSRTIQAATTVEGFGSKTIQNTVALSNAFNELTTSAKEAIKTERLAAEAASGWDKFWNGVFTIAGKDRSSKLADSIAKQISSSIDILSREGLADEYSAQIKKILNVTNLKDIDAVARAWKNLSKEQQTSVLAIQENSNRALGNVSSALQGFKDKTDTALTAYKTFTNSFVDTSPLFKLGEAYIDIGQSLAQVAAAGPNRIAQAFEELANNSQKAALFGKDFVKAFAPMAEDFKKQKAALDALNVSLDKQVDARKNLASASSVITTESGAAIIGPNMGRRAKQDSEIANENIRLTNRAIATIRTELLEKGTKILIDAGKQAVDTGLALINRSIANARTTADINISKVISSVLTGPRKLEAENQIRQRELKLQLEDVKITENLINIQSTLVDEMKLANALQAEANALQKGDKSAIERTTKETQKARAAVGQVEGIDPAILAEVAKLQKENEQRRTKSLESKKIAITGEMQASTLSTALQMPGATLQQQEQLAKITDRKLAADRANLDVLTSIAGVTSTTSILTKQSAEASALKRTQDSEIATINADIEKTEKAKAAAKGLDVPRLKDELKVLEKLKTETQAAQKAERDTTGLKNRQELLSEEIVQIGRRTELERSNTALQNTLAQTALDTRSQELSLYSSAYGLSKNLVINQQADLELRKAQLDTSIAVGQAEAELAQKREEAQARKNALGEGETVKAQEIATELKRQEDITKNTILGLQAQGAAKADILDKTRQVNLEQERYNELLTTSSDFANTLKMGFEGAAESSQKIAAALGGVATTMAEVAVNADKRAKAEKLAQENVDKAFELENYEAVGKAQQEQAELKKKNAKQELADDISTINSTKKLFKEKTAAYKILNGIEKVMHVTKLAMDAKELAVKLFSLSTGTAAKAGAEAADTSLTLSGTMSRLGAYAAEIYGKTIGQLGPIAGPAVASALVATMFGLFGKGGGSSAAFTPSSEQRQETQGTAMGYNAQGEKVQVRRGVFGDTEAKSESIVKSLEIMRDNSVAGLSYDDKMLRALENLNNALDKTAQGLYKVTGLRAGSLSGITEGTNTSGGLLGIGGLFSKSVTKDVIDSGIQLKGTFLELIKGAEGTINTFETVSTTVKKSGLFGIGGSTKTYVDTKYQDLLGVDAKAAAAINNAFAYAGDLLYQIADTAGVTAATVTDSLSKISVDEMVSLRGLKGEEFTKQLSAVIGSVLDDASLAIFGSFEQYARFGEGMLETVTRVIDTNKKISQSINNIGINVDLTKVYDITEVLAEAAGGLSKFLDQTKFFADNFLTEAERLAPVQKSVTTEMARLGYASIDTRQEFKNIVQTLDLNTIAGRETYQSLMNVQEGFDKVTAAAEKLADSAKSLLTKYVELTGTDAEVLATQRAAILAATDPVLVATQEYVFALEDVKTAQANLTTARKAESDSLKSTVTNLKNYADSLRKFSQGLLLGTQSTLTPEQKYKESKSQFDRLLETATGAASTPAEIAAKNDAISQLQGASTAFLDASRIYNASSAQYTQDFNLVQSALASTADSLDAQSTDAQKQLDALGTINDSVLTVADAIAKLDLAKQVADGLKEAGISSYSQASKTATITGGTVFGTQGGKIDQASAKTYLANALSDISASSNPEPMVKGLYDMLTQTWGLNSYQVADISGYSREQVLKYFGAWGLPAFAAGTNYVPEDMLAQIHQGERIIPAADNAQLMQNLNNREETNRVLVAEIRNLRQEVQQLREQQAKETGNIIMANLDAQQRNAEQIESALVTTSQQTTWSAKVREGVKLK